MTTSSVSTWHVHDVDLAIFREANVVGKETDRSAFEGVLLHGLPVQAWPTENRVAGLHHVKLERTCLRGTTRYDAAGANLHASHAWRRGWQHSATWRPCNDRRRVRTKTGSAGSLSLWLELTGQLRRLMVCLEKPG